jgi:hypothetical protein
MNFSIQSAKSLYGTQSFRRLQQIDKVKHLLSGGDRIPASSWCGDKMPNQISSRFRITPILALLSVAFYSTPVARSRIPVPPEIADVRDLAQRAPLVFRGQVGGIAVLGISGEGGSLSGTAIIRVDRQYKGRVPAEVSIQFAYDPMQASNGHDCIKFTTGGYWLVFANPYNAGIELADDCQGALPVSAQLGPQVRDFLWLPQMEADFLAGLLDPDRENRLVSLQRLGGLKMPTSRAALHRVIEGPDPIEAKWAMYAALRTGDATVLPKVKSLLRTYSQPGTPETYIALTLQDVSDPAAAEGLISILESSKHPLARSTAIKALAENLRDPRTALVFAAHLSDEDPYVRFEAYLGIGNITHADACLPTAGKTPDEKVGDCKAWWQRVGHTQSWN